MCYGCLFLAEFIVVVVVCNGVVCWLYCCCYCLISVFSFGPFSVGGVCVIYRLPQKSTIHHRAHGFCLCKPALCRSPPGLLSRFYVARVMCTYIPFHPSFQRPIRASSSVGFSPNLCIYPSSRWCLEDILLLPWCLSLAGWTWAPLVRGLESR